MAIETKRSVYVFLTSLLGVLLFLMLHRLAIFFLITVTGTENSILGLSYIDFVALDFFTLLFAMILGSWYGIWLGEYWYEQVYIHNVHGGLVSFLAGKFWQPKKVSSLKKQIHKVTTNMEKDLWELEDLAKEIPEPKMAPKPIKRKIARAPRAFKKKTII